MIRANQTIIGPVEKPDEIVLSLFPKTISASKINPQTYRIGNKSSNAQKRYNRKKSNSAMINMALNNFISSDLFITLTYNSPPSSLEAAERELTRFLKKLQRFYSGRGIHIAYIAVTGSGDKNGRYHHHMLLKQDPGIDWQDIIARWSTRGKGPLGHVDIEVIRGNKLLSENRNDDIEDVYYVARYVVQNAISSTNKRFRQSEGLKPPVQITSDETFSHKEYKSICDNPDSVETALALIRKLCPDSDYVLADRIQVTYIEGAGYYHVSARLRRCSDRACIDYCMPSMFESAKVDQQHPSLSYINGDKNDENITARRAIEKWILLYKKKIPNLDIIMNSKWRKSMEKYMARYVNDSMSDIEAIECIDSQLKTLNKFSKALLTHIGKMMNSGNMCAYATGYLPKSYVPRNKGFVR